MKNKILKRISAIFTAVCIVMPGVCAFAGNNSAEDTETAVYTQESIFEELEVLNKLKITGGYNADEFSPYESITLGEFYGMVFNIKSECAVLDISDAEEVKTVAQGQGTPLENEDLSKTVSCIDAVKILLELTGNAAKLKRENRNPSVNQYMTEAARVGIFDGIKITPEKVLDRLTAMRVILNTADADYTEVVYYSNGQVQSIKKTEHSVLEEYRDIYILKGILTQTSDTSLYGEAEFSDGFVMVDSEIYRSEIDCSEFLGYKIEAYAQNNDTDEDVILCIEKSSLQKEIVINSVDIETVSENLRSIRYISNKKQKTLSIMPSMRVIYNGAHLDRFTAQTLKPKTGKLVFVDNNNDGKYEVCHIEDYLEMAVASLNRAEKKIFGRIYANGSSEVFDYNDYEKISVYKNGEQIRLSEIERNNVVSILAPQSTKARLKIYVSDKIVTGYVNAVNSTEDEIEADGETYKISNALLNNIEAGMEKYPEAGKTYLMRFDVFGEIFCTELETESGASYGYMRAIAESGTIEKKYEVRIFTMDSKWITKEFAKKVKLNGEKATAAQDVFSSIVEDGNFEPMLIMYGLNSEGKINRIETPQTREGVFEGRLISGGKKARPYLGSLRELGYYDINIGADTKLVVIPADRSSEDSYCIVSTSKLGAGSSYECTPYNLDEFRVPDVIVINDGENIKNSRMQQEMYVVTAKVGVRTGDGNFVDGLRATSGAYKDLVLAVADNCKIQKEGETATYSLGDIREGDLIAVRFNNISEVDYIKICFSAADGVQYLYPSEIKVMNQILSGRVIDINDDRSVVRVECGDDILCMRTMAAGTPVAFYNNDTNEAGTGSFTDVAPGDFIVFKMTEMIMHSAVVIENLG